MSDISTGDLSNILNLLSAASALGTAAMGLVDASKVFGGGPSNFGFGYVESALEPFLGTKAGTGSAFDGAAAMRTLKANWINGVAKADQKAKAKALVHLNLTRGNATTLAAAAGVDASKLDSLITKTATGAPLAQDEINVLGQFDAVLSAVLDSAYERGDQKYRNSCKLLALAASTVLGAIGGFLVYGSAINSRNFCISVLIGVIATPLAPVAKDLVSSLQAAVKAVGAARR